MAEAVLPRIRTRRRKPLSPWEKLVLIVFFLGWFGLTMSLLSVVLEEGGILLRATQGFLICVNTWLIHNVWPVAIYVLRDWWDS